MEIQMRCVVCEQIWVEIAGVSSINPVPSRTSAEWALSGLFPTDGGEIRKSITQLCRGDFQTPLVNPRDWDVETASDGNKRRSLVTILHVSPRSGSGTLLEVSCSGCSDPQFSTFYFLLHLNSSAFFLHCTFFPRTHSTKMSTKMSNNVNQMYTACKFTQTINNNITQSYIVSFSPISQISILSDYSISLAFLDLSGRHLSHRIHSAKKKIHV